MDKSKRKKGEFYLHKWAEGLLSMEKIQSEINTIRKSNNAFQDIYLENKSDIEDCYKVVLAEKLSNLKNIIETYKFVEDIINNLEPYERDTIRWRYIHKNSWQTISFKANVSLRHCFNIKNKVINQILEKLEE